MATVGFRWGGQTLDLQSTECPKPVEDVCGEEMGSVLICCIVRVSLPDHRDRSSAGGLGERTYIISWSDPSSVGGGAPRKAFDSEFHGVIFNQICSISLNLPEDKGENKSLIRASLLPNGGHAHSARAVQFETMVKHVLPKVVRTWCVLPKWIFSLLTLRSSDPASLLCLSFHFNGSWSPKLPSFE